MFKKRFSTKIRYMHAIAVITLFVLITVASPSAQAQTFTVLHSFTYQPDGAFPNSLIRDQQGNLYGTTRAGGAFECVPSLHLRCGTVFKMDSAGKETVLHTFAGGNDGAGPQAALVRDASGNLYGTTLGGNNISNSTVFKIAPNGKETVLHVFTGQSTPVCCQDSPVALDAEGNVYGMSPYVGDLNCGRELGCGTLYRVTRSGKFTLIHTFKGTDGAQPEGGLVRDANGNLYGAALIGGDINNNACPVTNNDRRTPFGCGTIFKLDAKGKFTVLHTFKQHADGSIPVGLIQDATGNLYGEATYGGDLTCYAPYGCGTIFKIDAAGKFSVLFTFSSANTRNPGFTGHLARDSKGNLYGAKKYDGSNADGFLFKLDPRGNLTNLFDFPTEHSAEGFLPNDFVLGSKGDFYGSMLVGGHIEICDPKNSGGCGTVYHLTF
jgi:uncharacterized repeat protein (TIGR03803 family)